MKRLIELRKCSLIGRFLVRSLRKAGQLIQLNSQPSSSASTILNSEALIGHPLSICNLIDSLPREGKAEDQLSMLEIVDRLTQTVTKLTQKMRQCN